MNSFDWAIIQLFVLFWGFIAFVLFMVMAPVVLISANIKAHKKKQEESNGTSASQPQATAPGVAVSEKDGRIIAMEVPDQEPVTSVAEQPQKDGINIVRDVLLPVAGKAVVAIAAHQFKHRHHK